MGVATPMGVATLSAAWLLVMESTQLQLCRRVVVYMLLASPQNKGSTGS